MEGGRFEAALKRDNLIVSFALATVAALAWWYVLWLAHDMRAASGTPATDMQDMNMPGMLSPQFAAWTLPHTLFVFAMWTVMMVGMMTPSAAPMILVHEQVGTQVAARGKPFVATGWFVAGLYRTCTSCSFTSISAPVCGSTS